MLGKNLLLSQVAFKQRGFQCSVSAGSLDSNTLHPVEDEVQLMEMVDTFWQSTHIVTKNATCLVTLPYKTLAECGNTVQQDLPQPRHCFTSFILQIKKLRSRGHELELKHRLNSVTAKCAVLIGEGQWEVSK
jgi:hypothetical protein